MEGRSRTPDDARWTWAEAGTGALCAQAQADGVPCFEIGRACDTCEQAVRPRGTGRPPDGTTTQD